MSVFRFLFTSPAKYERYIGIIGNMQGEMNEIIPSKKVIKYIKSFHSLYQE